MKNVFSFDSECLHSVERVFGVSRSRRLNWVFESSQVKVSTRKVGETAGREVGESSGPTRLVVSSVPTTTDRLSRSPLRTPSPLLTGENGSDP